MSAPPSANIAIRRPKDAPSPSPSPSPSQSGRQTPKDRIDGLLEVARSRKSTMDDPLSISPGLSPRAQPDHSAAEGTESSADESTSIFRNESRRNTITNYQSTAIRRPIRSRPSTTSVRRAGRVVPPEEHGEADVDEHESWWARILSDYGSIELENKGSVARDHLALERTFLAWLRTSLAFASIGIAITQLFRLNTTSASQGTGSDPYQRLRQMGKPLGATFLGISIMILFVGFHRYFESQHWIIRGKFPASRGSIALVATVTFSLIVASLAIVIIVEPGKFEKR